MKMASSVAGIEAWSYGDKSTINECCATPHLLDIRRCCIRSGRGVDRLAPYHKAAFEEVFRPLGIDDFDYPERGWRTADVVENVLRAAHAYQNRTGPDVAAIKAGSRAKSWWRQIPSRGLCRDFGGVIAPLCAGAGKLRIAPERRLFCRLIIASTCSARFFPVTTCYMLSPAESMNCFEALRIASAEARRRDAAADSARA